VGGPEALSPLEVVKTFEEESGRTFEVEKVPETKLREQLDSANDSLEKSLAGLFTSTRSSQMTENLRSTCFRNPFKTHFDPRLMQKGKAGGCLQGESLLDLWGLQDGAAREYVRTCV
jgi:hypothetical protein